MRSPASIPTLLISTIAAISLTACQLEDPFGAEKDTPPATDKPTPRASQRLAPAPTDDGLLEFLRNGLIESYGVYEEYNNCWECAEEDTTATESSPAPVMDDGETKQAEPASETNLIEAGVDEADWLKYDNDSGLLFYSIQPQWYGGWYDVVAADVDPAKSPENIQPEKSRGKIDVFQLESTGTHTAISSFALGENANHIQGLYTAGDDQLLALYSKSEPYDDWYSPYQWRQGKVAIEAINTGDANELKQSWNLEIDGYLVDSRRIGNQLYLVTRFSPQIKGLSYNRWDKAVVENNKALIAAAQLDELLPSIKIDGTSQPLMPSSRCLIPTETELGYGYSMLTSITRVNLDKPNDWQSSCAIAPVSQIYMNQDALYLMRGYNWQDQKTELHRFELENLNYTDSVNVPGSMGWRSDKFRIKEQTLSDKKVLTVITSTLESRDWLHQLFNYKVSDQGAIELLARLPNENNPEKIGKPGENIHGARIEGNSVFIVTFETTDPLYKIDLTNPAQPKVLGELEIPGFSDYLHPVNDNLLIGVGYQTLESTRRVKISLYDVSTDKPAVISEQLIGNKDSWNYTAAAWDHHAFSFLDYGNGKYRFTVPSVSYQWDNRTYTSTDINQLSLFEIDTNKIDENDISQAAALTLDAQANHYYGGNSARSILIGESIHFAAGNHLASALWETPQTKQQSAVKNDEPPVYYPIGIDVGAID